MILVLIDHDRGELDALSLRALTAARKLSDEVHAVVIGSAGAGLSTIVGEFVNGRDGLGARILTANNVLDIAQVFAVMLILGAMAALFDLILRMIRKKVLFWSPSERRVGV